MAQKKDVSPKEDSKKHVPEVADVSEILHEPTPDMTIASSHDSLKDLIEKNIKWSQVLYTQNKAIKRRLTIMAFGSYVRLVLILTPIILGIIYLPPLVADWLGKYHDLLNTASSSIPLEQIFEQLFGGGASSTSGKPQ